MELLRNITLNKTKCQPQISYWVAEQNRIDWPRLQPCTGNIECLDDVRGMNQHACGLKRLRRDTIRAKQFLTHAHTPNDRLDSWRTKERSERSSVFLNHMFRTRTDVSVVKGDNFPRGEWSMYEQTSISARDVNLFKSLLFEDECTWAGQDTSLWWSPTYLLLSRCLTSMKNMLKTHLRQHEKWKDPLSTVFIFNNLRSKTLSLPISQVMRH